MHCGLCNSLRNCTAIIWRKICRPNWSHTSSKEVLVLLCARWKPSLIKLPCHESLGQRRTINKQRCSPHHFSDLGPVGPPHAAESQSGRNIPQLGLFPQAIWPTIIRLLSLTMVLWSGACLWNTNALNTQNVACCAVSDGSGPFRLWAPPLSFYGALRYLPAPV